MSSNGRAIVEQIRKASKALAAAATWRGTLTPVDVVKDDYLYELLCYFEGARSSAPSFRPVVSGKMENTPRGKKSALWPKKPGLKVNFSYLSLRNKVSSVEVFQLCPGIKILDRHAKFRAPDISLLAKNAPFEPTHEHLLGCWDAKYLTNEMLRVADTAFSDFEYTFRQLGQPSTPSGWRMATSSNAFKASGIITNGDYSTEQLNALVESKLSETRKFPKNPETRP